MQESDYRRLTVMTADLVTPPDMAEIVTRLEDVTRLTVIGKLTELAPAGRVTLAGTEITLLLLEREMVSGVAAAPLKVMVPVDDCPLSRIEGTVSRANTAGCTVKPAVLDDPE